MSNQVSTCYVVAQSGTDLGSIRRALETLGVSVTSTELVPPAGEASSVTLRRAFKSVDFVVGVLSDDVDQAGAIFEIGVAAGLGKSIFIIYGGNATGLPAFQFLPSLRAKSTSDETVAFHLRQFIRNSKKFVKRKGKGLCSVS